MKKFLQDNPTIAFGLGLPLVLVVLFLLVSGIPSLLVADPEYDVLYATEVYGGQNDLQFVVVDGEVQVFHHPSTNSGRVPRLWRFDGKSGAVQEVTILLPSTSRRNRNNATDEHAEASSRVPVPELTDLKLDSSSIAPDGYEFINNRDRYSRNVFGGLFYSHRYRNQAAVVKNGRSIRLPNKGRYAYSYGTEFVGWIVSD